MPIKNIYIDGKTSEVHVVGGHPYSLSGWLFGVVTAAGTNQLIDAYLAHNNDITVRYTAHFKGTQDGDLYRGHGVTINLKTGNIAVANDLPDPRLHNFLVDVVVKDLASNKEFKDRARIHVHRSIRRIWMTPPELAINRIGTGDDATGYKFAVRAEFDDDVIGDVTEDPYIEYSAPGDRVSRLGSLQIKASDNNGDTVTITAQVKYAPSTLRAEATMRILAPWSSGTPLQATLVPGSAALPPPADVATMMNGIRTRRNVLFICDGFSQAQKTTYESFVDDLVHFMGEGVCAPYDELRGSMYFWRVFLPSPQAELPIGGQAVILAEQNGTLTEMLVPTPQDPPPATGVPRKLSLAQLTRLVGLPTRRHVTGTDNGALRAEWNALYGVDPYVELGPTDTIRDDRVARWRKLGNWGLVDEVDTPLGMVNGNLHLKDNLFTDFHSGRTTRERINDLLRGIVADTAGTGGTPVQLPIGEQFATQADGTRPRDHDLVCIIVPSASRALNGTGYFLVEMRDTISFLQDPVSNVHTVFASPLPTVFDRDAGRLLAHELSHSFSLEDEYGEAEGPPTSPLNAFYVNVQADTDVRDSTTNISGEKIKWRWHRIHTAAVTSGQITVNQGTVPPTITIPVRAGEGEPFVRLIQQLAPEELPIVHLRAIDLAHPLPGLPVLSVPLQLTGGTADLLLAKEHPSALQYPNKRIVSDLPVSFPPGSVVYNPVKAPASAHDPATYPYAEMVARNIRDHITTSMAPLTPMPSVKDDRDTQIPMLDGDIPGLVLGDQGIDRARLVGLYSGGARFHIGVFHPTGFCMMRHRRGENREFCAVCRYILTEVIDPSKHGAVDRWYARIYPLKN